MQSIDLVKTFWETCSSAYAHLKYRVDQDNKTLRTYEDIILKDIDFNNKTVIDYGCAAGYLGAYLYKNKNIKKYIGIDIADRALNKARAILKNTNAELYTPSSEFIKFNADIFICISCIQHFPDRKYLDMFLSGLNDSNIKNIILQIRYNVKTVFCDGYKTDHIGSACLTNEKHISKILTNYKLKFKHGEPVLYRANYLHYEL